MPDPPAVLFDDESSIVDGRKKDMIGSYFPHSSLDLIPIRIGIRIRAMDRNTEEDRQIPASLVIGDLILHDAGCATPRPRRTDYDCSLCLRR